MNDLFWLTLILLVIAALLRSEIFFYLLYVVVGLQVVARVWIWRTASRVTWQRSLLPAAFPNDPVTVELTITNHSALPLPWLAVHESIPATLRNPAGIRQVLSLGAGEARTISYTIQSSRRGLYRLGPLTMRTGDVLGLRELPLEAGATDAFVVYPQVLPLAALGLPASLPFGELAATRSIFSDPARPAGVRGYQPGDSLRQIDWKNSARANQLQVRRQQPAIALETLIALVFSHEEYAARYAYDLMERGIVTAASIATYLSTQRQPIGLCTTGIDALTEAPATALKPAAGRAHLIELLQLLGRLTPAVHGDLLTTLTPISTQLSWGGTVVVITDTCDPAFIERVLPLKRRGLNIALVLLAADPSSVTLARTYKLAVFQTSRSGRPVEASAC